MRSGLTFRLCERNRLSPSGGPGSRPGPLGPSSGERWSAWIIARGVSERSLHCSPCMVWKAAAWPLMTKWIRAQSTRLSREERAALLQRRSEWEKRASAQSGHVLVAVETCCPGVWKLHEACQRASKNTRRSVLDLWRMLKKIAGLPYGLSGNSFHLTEREEGADSRIARLGRVAWTPETLASK